MKIARVVEETDLGKLEAVWNGLLAQSASETIFLTWEWVSSWWNTYGGSDSLSILLAFDEQGCLRGIAPTRKHTIRKYGRTFPAISVIGDGSNDSDYLDFIIARGWEEATLRAFFGFWAEAIRHGTVLLINEIPDSSPNLPVLEKMGKERGMLCVETSVPCATAQLPDNFEDYLASLRPRFRTKVRSVLRNLEGRAEVMFRYCESPQDLPRLLPALFDLHTQRWMEQGQPGVFGGQPKRDFYLRLSQSLLARGWLRFCWMEWKGRILACQYGFVYGNCYFHLQEGYDPRCDHWSVGIALRAWSIRELMRQGIREYDFLAGVGRHKTEWGTETKHSRRMIVCRETARNVVLCRGPEWVLQARDSLKAMIPEKVLDLRSKFLQARQGNGSGTASNGNGNGSRRVAGHSVRNLLANVYFYTPLPALVQPLRDRYQLTVTANRRLPKLRWQKRPEPCARILYFHRINDDRDPFAPAMPVDLFEREMGHLARNYRVVGLAEVVRRLFSPDQPADPVAAITFDDGYRDNYANAFPILERLGLPATIFLTTGYVDSDEPIWFERLSLAVKMTSQESIDLEIDRPRRFWLRSLEERVAANDQIFSILRRLPDRERREWLPQILRQLAVKDESRLKSSMLRWDEIRLMKSKGIDFGGHTVSHPFLSRLRREEIFSEISQCKTDIEEQLQVPVEHFAYPNGREDDFNAAAKEAVRQSGYRAAFTTIWGLNYRDTDPLEMRRGGPWEESAAMFASKLDWYQLRNA